MRAVRVLVMVCLPCFCLLGPVFKDGSIGMRSVVGVGRWAEIKKEQFVSITPVKAHAE